MAKVKKTNGGVTKVAAGKKPGSVVDAKSSGRQRVPRVSAVDKRNVKAGRAATGLLRDWHPAAKRISDIWVIERAKYPELSNCSFSITDGVQDPSSHFGQVFCDQGCDVVIADYDASHSGPVVVPIRMDWLATATQGAQQLLTLMIQLQHVKGACEAIAKAVGPLGDRAQELLGGEP